MIKGLKLAWYQMRLKAAYLRYLSIREEYDCGNALFEQMSGRGRDQRKIVDDLYDKCIALEAAQVLTVTDYTLLFCMIASIVFGPSAMYYKNTVGLIGVSICIIGGALYFCSKYNKKNTKDDSSLT